MNPTPSHIYPLLPATVSEFSHKITTPIMAGQSVTFIYPHLMGGERAWIRFLFDHPQAADFTIQLKDYRLVMFDPTEVIDSSHAAFLYHLLHLLDSNIKDYSEYSQLQIVTHLRTLLDHELPKQEIVIFFLKLNAFPNLNPILGNLLYSLWRPHKRHLHFVTTLTPPTIIPQLPELVGDFTEVLMENVRYISPLPPADIKHSILHWESILNYQYSDSEISAIIKHSQGSPYVSKILCQNLAQPYDTSPDVLCKQIVSQQFGILNSPQPLSQLPKHSFSPQELSVVNLFITHPKQIITRDQIATALWGNQTDEKYSDWAIDKFISLIRQKLILLNCATQIRTLKGQGYLTEE